MTKIYNFIEIFFFLNKQKKCLNEFNGLVDIVVVISLVIKKINELVRIYSLRGLRSYQLLSFSKKSHCDLDLDPIKLKCELVQGIVISNTCVKLY